jgi:hypothetical protein
MAFGKQITPLRRDDIPELGQFLINGFGVPATSSYFSHEVLSWKYFDGPAGPSGDSVCSLVARSAGKIIAHIGICFRQFVSGDGATPVPTMHAIDWLGSAEHPGTGSILMLEAFATCKTQFAVGGSAQSQTLFPRLGFEPRGRVARFRRVLSPFHRLRTTGQRRFRKWAGTTKDAAAAWRARLQACTQSGQMTVELRSVPAFTAEIDGLRRQSSRRIVACRHDHLLLNYLLRYPLSGFSAWTIHTSERMIGFALLKITPHGRIQLGKIVDCWLDTDEPSYWQAAVAALSDRLRTLSADDVTCYAIHPSLHTALLQNGFSKSGESNVCVRDKQQLLPRDLPFGLSGFEADGAII